jgi:hypothetical protein
MKTSLLAVLATALVSTLVACAPADENAESSAAAQVAAGDYRSPRGRTLRVRNNFNRILQQVRVSTSGGESRNILQGGVSPNGIGMLRIPDSSAFNDCELTLEYVFSARDNYSAEINGCSSPALFDSPRAGLGGSYDDDGNTNGGSKSGSSSDKGGGGEDEGSGDDGSGDDDYSGGK